MPEIRSAVLRSRYSDVLFYDIKYVSEYPFVKCLYVFEKAVAKKWLNETTEIVGAIERHQSVYSIVYQKA